MPSRKHEHGTVAVDDDDAREEGSVRALELDARRWLRHHPKPVEERLGARRAAGAATELFEEDVADDLGYGEGQIASEMTATRIPAMAAAAPFLVESALSTRRT